MENFIYGMIQQVNGYSTVYVYLFTYISGWIQVAFPPYPGEVFLIMNGCIQFEKPLLQSLSLFFTYWLAIVSANFVLFELGIRKGVTLLQHPMVSRFFSVKSNVKMQGLINRYGLFLYMTAIYIPGMFLPLVFFSGIMKYKRINAFTGIMMATFIHDIILFIGGRVVGNNIKNIASFITVYKNVALCIAVGFAAIFIIYMLLKNKNQNTNADIV